MYIASIDASYRLARFGGSQKCAKVLQGAYRTAERKTDIHTVAAFGRDGPQVSRIGLGWTVMTESFGSADGLDESLSTIEEALDCAITHLKHRRFLWDGATNC